MSHDLPATVRSAIAELTAGHSLAVLADEHAALSRGYRAARKSAATVRSAMDVAAYLIGRLPATYAAVHRALAELSALWPEFDPTSLADVGCGPGTAILAAIETYPDLTHITGVDGSGPFLDIAPRLAASCGYDQDRTLQFLRGDFRTHPAVLADLTILSYGLVEGTVAESAALALRLMTATRGALVLVEPGSRAGFARLAAARTALIGAGFRILAPCTHQATCPIVDPDWCHFAVRLARSRDHRRIKSADAPFEDEKFSYLIATAAQVAPDGLARVIAPVHHDKVASRFPICDATGASKAVVPTRDPAHKQLRKCSWGAVFPAISVNAARNSE